MENHHFQWENPLSMVIFNSYVTNYQRVVLHFDTGDSPWPATIDYWGKNTT